MTKDEKKILSGYNDLLKKTIEENERLKAANELLKERTEKLYNIFNGMIMASKVHDRPMYGPSELMLAIPINIEIFSGYGIPSPEIVNIVAESLKTHNNGSY